MKPPFVPLSSWMIKVKGHARWRDSFILIIIASISFLFFITPQSNFAQTSTDEMGFFNDEVAPDPVNPRNNESAFSNNEEEENDPTEELDDEAPETPAARSLVPAQRGRRISPYPDYLRYDGETDTEENIEYATPNDDEIQWEDENDYLAEDDDYYQDGEIVQAPAEEELLEEEELPGDTILDETPADVAEYQDEIPEEAFEHEDDVYTDGDGPLLVPEEDYDENVVQYEDDDILRDDEGAFVAYESPLPPIAARTYALKLDRKSRTGKVYLFQDLEEALPREGRILLLRSGEENAMAFRVLKRYPGRQRVAAVTLRRYDFGDLTRGATYTGIEKLADLPFPPAPIRPPVEPEIEEEVRELEDDMGYVDAQDYEDESEIADITPEISELPEEVEVDPSYELSPLEDEDVVEYGMNDEEEITSPIDESYGGLQEEDFDLSETGEEDPYEYEDDPDYGTEESLYAEDEERAKENYGDYVDAEGDKEGLDDKEYDDLDRSEPTGDEDEYSDYVVTDENEEPLPDDETEDKYRDYVEFDPEAEQAAEDEPEFESVENPNKNTGMINADVLEEVALRRSSGPENLILMEKNLVEPEKNWLTASAGVLQGRGTNGRYSYFSGGGLSYSRTFKTGLFTRTFNREDALSGEFSLMAFKVLAFASSNDSYTVLPLVGSLRYELKMSEFLTLYAYAGAYRNFVVTSFNANANALNLLNSIGIAGGAGALLTIGPKWYLRGNLGIDASSIGLVVKF